MSVLSRRQAGRLLVVATVRTEGLAEPSEAPSFAPYLDGLARAPMAESITLKRLDTDDVRRQLAGLLDEPLPPDLLRRIVEVGDGVPFVVEELAAARGSPELSSVGAVAEARLGSLAGGARRLVEGSALGDGHLAWPLLDAVMGLSPDELDEALTGAVRAGILEETPNRGGVRFRHALLRDAADRLIPPAARRGWHRRWAEAIAARPGVLPADLAVLAIAYHWSRAGDSEKEARAAHAAVGAAARVGGGGEELQLWQRLLDLWHEAPEVLSALEIDRHVILHNVLWLALTLPGDAGLELLRREMTRATDDLERAVIQLRLFTAATAKGSLETTRDLGEQGEAWEQLFRAALPDPLARDGLAHCSALLPLDEPRAGDILGEVRALAERAGEERTTLLISARQSYLWHAQGYPELAVEELERRVTEARSPAVFELWSLEGNLMWCLAIMGRYAEVDQVFDRACARVPDPPTTGVPFEHLVENVTFCWTNTGQWARAEELIRTCLPFWGAGMRSSEVRLAEIELLRTGRLSDPARWRAAIDVEPVPSGADPVWIAETVAWDAAGGGDLAEMRRLVAGSWSYERPAIATDVLWSAIVRAIRFEVDAAVRRPDPADRDAAEAHVATIEDVAAQLYRFGDLGVAWDAEVTAQLARFRGEECRDLFAAAVEAWDRVGHPYDGAVAQLCLAEAVVADDRDAARKHAEQALATAKDLGAGPLEQDAEELLKRYRLATRAVAMPGKPGSLTGREREVLALLAEGRTNGQIATELFMSAKTASVHVSRILAKLGAENRTEAAAVARRAGLL